MAKEGSASQSIKDMALAIQERRYKTDKPSVSSENYPPVPAQLMCSSGCAASHMQHVPAGPLAACNHQHISQATPMCHPNNNSMCINKMMYANGVHMPGGGNAYPNYAHAAMPHSKSLEHYPEQNLINLNGHSRHSFEHGACDFGQRPHDCADGVPMANYCSSGCTLDHPYNVSGNRYPLPATISNQLSQPDGYGGDVPPAPPPPCATAIYSSTVAPSIYSNGCMGAAAAAAAAAPTSCCHQNVYFDCNGAHRPMMPNMTEYNAAYGATASPPCQKYYSAMPTETATAHRNGARAAANDHLIDFEDKTIAPKYGNAFKLDDVTGAHRSDIKSKANDQQMLSKQLKYLQQQSAQSGDEIDAPRKPSSQRKHNRNAELLAEYEDHMLNSSRVSDFDSFDSSNNMSVDRNTESTTSKIQDGVGSYETWDYVFQNIGKNGYNKHTKETKDVSVHVLDLDAMAISAAPGEKRRSRNTELGNNGGGGGGGGMVGASVSKVNGDTRTTIRSGELIEKPLSAIAKANNRTTSKSPSAKETNGVVPKSVLKSNYTGQQTNGSKNGGLPDDFVIVGNRAKTGTIKKVATKSMANGDAHRDAAAAPAKTNGKASTIEWPCKHCTFLNPTTTNICQMCYKSKDFMPDGPKASTCV